MDVTSPGTQIKKIRHCEIRKVGAAEQVPSLIIGVYSQSVCDVQRRSRCVCSQSYFVSVEKVWDGMSGLCLTEHVCACVGRECV